MSGCLQPSMRMAQHKHCCPIIAAMLEARIQQQFFDSADALNQAAEPLARALSLAAQAMVTCLTAGHKVLSCAPDGAGALAAHATQLLLSGFERERPPLAALTVIDQGASASAVQQIRALGHPGDLLLCLALAAEPRATRAVIDAAHDNDMSVLVLAPPSAAGALDLLHETDVQIELPSERLGRLFELQLLALHCLCDAIDTQLLGDHIA